MIVSWISFLIPMDVIPGRMALLVTLFLVLVNIFNTVTTNTPKVSIYAIDFIISPVMPLIFTFFNAYFRLG